MAQVIGSTEIFFEPFEPKMSNRFVMNFMGFPAFMMKSVSAISLAQNEIILNHINVYRKIKGKTTWGDITMNLYDPITPSGAQAVMEWVRLHHESVTGRDGYSDFYKRDFEIQILGPVGDVVSEWIIKGALIVEASFGEYNWDSVDTAQNISMTVQPDYCVLNF